MLSQSQRAAIMELNTQKVSLREIAQVLKVSRLTVREVLRSGSTEVPALARAEICDPYRQQILELMPRCKNNLVRVQEELAASGAHVSYSALTAFCRRHGIGQAPVVAAGRYTYLPGAEMQHDTSPHDVELGGKRRKAQTASAVLCYSRMLFFQLYPTFTRFDCKVFLTEALRYFNGSTKRVEIDNTHVVVLRGTGRAMVPVPEMAAFADRFGFQFAAHELGDANRSAHVERQFWHIENNFLAGRSFDNEPDQYLCAAVLRPGNVGAGAGAVGVLRRLIKLVRSSFSKARIRVRLDGGFATPAVFDFLDAEPNVEYVVAMASNAVLNRHAADALDVVRLCAGLTEETEHVYGDTRYAARSWKQERRVIFKAEVVRAESKEPRDNPRFVVTNMKQSPKWIYEEVYCKRGDVENRIHLLDFCADKRVSCPRKR